jgi:hypothetical protein
MAQWDYRLGYSGAISEWSGRCFEGAMLQVSGAQISPEKSARIAVTRA